jgi:hypothetical protein
MFYYDRNLTIEYEGYLNPNIKEAWKEWVKTPVGEDIFNECLNMVIDYDDIDTEDYFLRFWVSLTRYPESVGGNSGSMRKSYVELVKLLGYPLEIDYKDPLIKINFQFMREAKSLSSVGDVYWIKVAAESIKKIHNIIHNTPKRILNNPYFPLLNIQSVATLMTDEERERVFKNIIGLKSGFGFPKSIRVLPMAFFMKGSSFMPMMNWRKMPF